MKEFKIGLCTGLTLQLAIGPVFFFIINITSPFAYIRLKYLELPQKEQRSLMKDSKDPKSPYVYPPIQ